MAAPARADTKNLRVYSVDPSQEVSRDFTVAVDGLPVPVLTVGVAPADAHQRWEAVDHPAASDGRQREQASVASFDLDAPCAVTVTCPTEVRSATILPTSFGISPQVEGRKVTFWLDRPRLLTLEVNGDWCHSLHLFANGFEAPPPSPDDPNVIYLGPGVHQLTQTLRVGDGQTLYLAGGAVLRGMAALGDAPVVLLEGKGITLRGRGWIDGGPCPLHTHHLVWVHGEDITVEGVTLCDSPTWNIPVRRSSRVALTNLKIFGCRANSDGIDICNSRDVTVTDCFLRTLDDLVVVKSDQGQGAVEHVAVRGCVLWNQVAHALSVGAELREPVDDVLFADCDVIHDKGREWTLRIYHCDDAVVSHVRFENIRVEESARPISLWINRAMWSLTPDRGHIRDVDFKDVTIRAAVPLRIELSGFDAEHRVEGVRFDDVRCNGRPLRREDVQTNAFVNDLVVTPAL